MQALSPTHGNMRQPCDQLSLRDLAVSIRQVIRNESEMLDSADPLQKICADNLDRLPH